MWSDSQRLGRVAIASSTSSGKSFGCGEVNRKRTSGWASASISRRPPKRRLAVGGGTMGLKPAARCASAYAALSAAPSVPPPLELSAYEFTFCPSRVTSR